MSPEKAAQETSLLAPSGQISLPKAGVRFWLAVAFLAVIFALGILAFILRWRTGWGDRPVWGYYAATFSFLLSTALTAPVVSVGLRIVGGPWRRPVCRVAELFSLVGILSFLWFLPLIRLIPPARGRLSIWYGLAGAPHVWETVAMAALVVAGMALLYWASIPDMANSREGSGKLTFLGRLAFSWTGSERQWRVLKAGLLLLGAFYFLMLVFVQGLFASDFALGLVPGWKDALFPAYHVMTALQTATALVTLTLFLLRKWGGLKDHIGPGTFKALGRLLLVVTLLWFYFWWSGFIVMWYGRRPEEELVLELFVTGPNRLFFALSLGLNFVIPFLLLLFNPIRKSILGPSMVSILVLLGTLFDRIRLFTASFSVSESGNALAKLPPARAPDWIDLFILLGGLSGLALTFLASIRLLPVLSWWEITEGLKLQAERRLGRKKVIMVVKPE